MKILSILLLATLLSLAACLIFANNNNNKNSLFVPKPKLHLTPNPQPKNGWVKQLKELPGYRGPNGERVPPTYPIFSGMVEITELEGVDGVIKMFMFYMMYGNVFDARDQVILFEGGGPGFPGGTGGSFLEGFGGTFLNAHSYTTGSYAESGIPSPLDNPYGYNNLGVVISLDNPPPTGYSYCTNQNASISGPSATGASCGTWTDEKVGRAQAQAFNVILNDHFPNLLKINSTATGKPRNLFSFSESYGGVYAAALAEQVFTRQEYSLMASRFAFQANGDACMGSDQICGNPAEQNPYWFLSFMRGHFQLPFDLWEDLIAKCGETTLKTKPARTYTGECLSSYNTVVKAAGRNFYTYNLYSFCVGNLFGAEEQATHNIHPSHGKKLAVPKKRSNGLLRSIRSQQQQQQQDDVSSNDQPINELLNVDGFVCMSDAIVTYFSHPVVKLALGVPSDMNYFVADNAVGLPYNFTQRDGFKIWSDILNVQNGKQAKYFNILPRPSDAPLIRVNAYEADADPGVLIPWVEQKWYEFAKNMSYSKTQEWTNWFLADPMRDPSNPYSQVAGGYKVEWGPNSELSFYTVRGSGHMVPLYRSHSAFGMVLDQVYSFYKN